MFISYEAICKQGGLSDSQFYEYEIQDSTHIKRIIDQVLRRGREHIQAADDIVHMIIDVCEIDLGFMTHVAYDLGRPGAIPLGLDECSATVDIVSTETVHERLYWFEGALVESKVAGHGVHYEFSLYVNRNH